MAINSGAREQAEARFNRKQLAKVEGTQAMAAYLTDARLMREKTERLRSERLARDAARQKIEALLPAVAKPPRTARKPTNLAVSKAPKPGRKTKRPITSTTLSKTIECVPIHGMSLKSADAQRTGALMRALDGSAHQVEHYDGSKEIAVRNDQGKRIYKTRIKRRKTIESVL